LDREITIRLSTLGPSLQRRVRLVVTLASKEVAEELSSGEKHRELAHKGERSPDVG